MAPGSCAMMAIPSFDFGLGKIVRPLRVSKEISTSSRPGQALVRYITTSSYTATSSSAGPWPRTLGPASSVACNASRGAAVLEDQFSLVSDDLATGRAAAAEALALAKAAALTARKAAALADLSNLSVLSELDLKAREEWGLSSLPGTGNVPVNTALDLPVASRSEWERLLGLAPTPAELLEDYISDKQKLSSAFRVGSAKPLQQISSPKKKKDVGAGPAKGRVVVLSGKKGQRSAKARRSRESGLPPDAELQVPKMLTMGVPGTLRDLMDATPGVNGLLTAEEEVTLAKGVQELLRLEKRGAELQEEIGRQPSREEWAKALGMATRDLERALTEGRRYKQRMVSCNMGLVIAVARKYSGWGLSLEEIMTKGCSGLIKAVEKFDHKRGFKFSTYAHWWIRQAIGRCVTEQSRTVRMPPHIYEMLARITKAKDMLVRELGRTPGDEEVAELVGMSATRLRKVLRSARPMVSMDKEMSEESEQTLGSFVASPVDESHEIDIERKLLNKDLVNVLHTLLPREREVLRLRYGLSDGRVRTLEEVGVRFNVTRERIRQLEHRALRKLREPNRSSVLQEYVV